jgi:RimJ/RimL family protein N-acetyltransferase
MSALFTARLALDSLMPGAFVGLCDVSEIGANQSAEIGIMIGRKFWGLSLAHEAIPAFSTRRAHAV